MSSVAFQQQQSNSLQQQGQQQGQQQRNVLPSTLFRFNNSNEFWANAELWRTEISPFISNSMTPQKLEQLRVLADRYANGEAGAHPIGLDIAVVLLCHLPDLFRMCWGPNYQKVANGTVPYQMAGVSLSSHREYSQTLRFMLGLSQGKYTPVLLRGGISSGCDSTKCGIAFDEKTKKVNYRTYLDFRHPVDVMKRSVTVSYQRTDPNQLPPKERFGFNSLMTMFEIMTDIHARKIAATSNLAQMGDPNSASSFSVADLEAMRTKEFALSNQVSVAGKFNVSVEQEWQTASYGYISVDIILPRYVGAPDQESINILSKEANKDVVGPISSYNKNFQIFDPEIASEIAENFKREAALILRAKAQKPNQSAPQVPEKVKREKEATRISKVSSWDPEHPEKPPVFGPLEDARGYTNLGNDWVVPALLDVSSNTQIASAQFPKWRGKTRCNELIAFEPIFMPLMTREAYEAKRLEDQAKTVVLPDGDSIYADYLKDLPLGIEDASASAPSPSSENRIIDATVTTSSVVDTTAPSTMTITELDNDSTVVESRTTFTPSAIVLEPLPSSPTPPLQTQDHPIEGFPSVSSTIDVVQDLPEQLRTKRPSDDSSESLQVSDLEQVENKRAKLVEVQETTAIEDEDQAMLMAAEVV